LQTCPQRGCSAPADNAEQAAIVLGDPINVTPELAFGMEIGFAIGCSSAK
jgi:hypothetical protein